MLIRAWLTAGAACLAALTVAVPAHASVTATVVVGCESLDVLGPVDACDGIDAGDVAVLASALGDEDGILEPADLAAADVDANQLQDQAYGGAGYLLSLYVFAFTSDDGVVWFDSDVGLITHVNDDGGPDELFPSDDGNAETCDGDDDADCGTEVAGNGDGVVVATLTDGAADAGDTPHVYTMQGTQVPFDQAILVVGGADEVFVEVSKTYIAATADLGAQCVDSADAFDAGQDLLIDRTIASATVVDSNGVALARVPVTFDTWNHDITLIDQDQDDPPGAPIATTGRSMDFGGSLLVAKAVVCAGSELGYSPAQAAIPDEDDSADLYASGAPANIALMAIPPAVSCTGDDEATVIATVTDAIGTPVADGTSVSFDVLEGEGAIAQPTSDATLDGVAMTVVTGGSFAQADDLAVSATSGAAQSIIQIDCSTSDSVYEAIEIDTSPFTHAQSTEFFDVGPLEQLPCGQMGATVWYVLKTVASPPASAMVQLTTVGSDFDTVIAIYEGWPLPPPETTLIDCENRAGPETLVTFYAHPARTYYVQIGGVQGATGILAFGAELFIDSDRDGCTDAHEDGLNPMRGGFRDKNYLWDFYDVTYDRAIDLQDTLAILARFGAQPGMPNYDPLFDRRVGSQATPWRTFQAFGTDVGIDVADAIANLQSFGHGCVAVPG